MNLQDARNLINFHYWGRNRMLDAVEPLTQEQFTRELGATPPQSTDLIAFYRENL